MKTSSPIVLYKPNQGTLWSAILEFAVTFLILKIYLTLRRLMSYIYGAPILDVSRSHTTTQHSR